MTTVDVWRTEIDGRPPIDPSALPAAEAERAARLRPPRARARWLTARLALRRVLARYLGEDPLRIELRIGSHGKPALADPAAALRFNLSHSGGMALIAVADGCEVGVDVEERAADRDFARLAEVGLDSAAAAIVREIPAERQAVAFYAAWVRQEAIAKCLGTGLGAPLPPQPVSVLDLDVGDGYAAALAVAGPAVPAVRERTLAPP